MAPRAWKGIIAAYGEFLPPMATSVTLHEGGTPLVPSSWLAGRLGSRVWLKLEGSNPTCSFKDRGMTVAVSRAAEEGARGVICASTGNTAASASAYAARAGLPCSILLPGGAVARGKLVQATAHGARVLAVEATFEEILRITVKLAAEEGYTLVNSLNPLRLEGQATVSYEICDALDRAPAVVVLPVGNGGNITACWMGFLRYHAAGRIDSRPVIIGVQAEGANPLVRGSPVAHPETVASAIRIGRPARWNEAVEAVEASGGRFLQVSDAEILAAQRALAEEGVFVEPASAAAVAGVLRLPEARLPDGDIVCIMTGHGLKDPDAVGMAEPLRVPLTPEELRAALA